MPEVEENPKLCAFMDRVCTPDCMAWRNTYHSPYTLNTIKTAPYCALMVKR